MLNIERASLNRLAWIAIFATTACRPAANRPLGANAIAPTPAVPGLHAVRVNGTILNYIDTSAAGARIHAHPIVMVHGAGGGITWPPGPGVQAFSAERRTISYSRRWHPPNPAPDEPGVYSAAVHAADLAALIEKLHLRQVDLVGSSYGGLVALEFACQHPDRVHALVLFEPGAFGLLPTVAGGDSLLAAVRTEHAVIRRLLERGDSAGAVSYYSSLMSGGVPDSTVLARAPEAVRARTLASGGMAVFAREMMANFDGYMPGLTCDDLRDVRMPVLLVRGAGTLPAFSVVVDALSRCLPQARVVTRPSGRGHGALLREDPAGYFRTVLDFLRTTERTRQGR